MLKSSAIVDVGISLRPLYAPELLKKNNQITWIEILFDNFRKPSKKEIYLLRSLSSLYPISLHCVGMNLASTNEVDYQYLLELKEIQNITQAFSISDHLCWTAFKNSYFHELLPLPYNKESLAHLSTKIRKVQDYLGKNIFLENISSYLEFSESKMKESEFLIQLCEKTGCYLLLDINNVYVNSFNHNFDPVLFLQELEAKYIKQYHIAGHKNCNQYLLDTHGESIIKEVWSLFEKAIEILGKKPVCIERDQNIPSFDKISLEIQKAKTYY